MNGRARVIGAGAGCLVVLVLAVGPETSRAQDGGGGSPRERYAELVREAGRATGSGRPLSDEERLVFIGEVYRHRHEMGLKFLELAEAHPDDPIAVEALMQAVWQVNTTPWPVGLVGEDGARRRAFEILLRDHLGSDRLGPLCERVSHGFCREYETFLRAVVGTSPHREVRAAATVSLAHFLHNRWQRIELCRGLPQAAMEFGDLYGADYLQRLLGMRPEPVAVEVEALCEVAIKEYADVRLTDGNSVAERAGWEIFGLRSLRVGQQASEITGIDQDGADFRLSDYRGKVVLLDFWSYV